MGSIVRRCTGSFFRPDLRNAQTTMVAVQVPPGDHAAIAFAGSQEHFELNAFKPVMIHNLMLVTALNRNVGYDKPKTAHQKDIARRESRTRLFDGGRV